MAADADDPCVVYYIHDATCGDPYRDGYIGITQDEKVSTLTDAVADASLMRRLSFSSEARGVNALLSKSSIVSTGHRLEQVARRRALAKKRSTITARYGCHLKATLKAM